GERLPGCAALGAQAGRREDGVEVIWDLALPRLGAPGGDAPERDEELLPDAILTREGDAFGEEPRQDRDARPISRIPEARTQAVTREHEEDALVILGATAVAVPGEDRIDEGAVHLQRPR